MILACSLVLGIIGAPLATVIQPHIDIFIAFLLFTACLRVGPRQAFGAMKDVRTSLVLTFVLQIVLPLSILFFVWLSGSDHPLIFALIFLTAAPALSGSPHLVALLGFNSAPALRQLVVGTAVLPLTVIPVFFLLPQLVSLAEIIESSFRLMIVIFLAAIVAFSIRLTILKEMDNIGRSRLDGTSVILLMVVVIGLMGAIQTEFVKDPANLMLTLGVATAANFGFQILATLVLIRISEKENAVPIGLIAGNRNIALFLTALPATTTDSLLLFIACYQIPMFLTPIAMRRFYRSFGQQES